MRDRQVALFGRTIDQKKSGCREPDPTAHEFKEECVGGMPKSFVKIIC